MLLACLLEPLRVVRDQLQADIRWTVVTHTDQPVSSSSGLRIAPDVARSHAPACDVFIIVGGDRFREVAGDPLLRESLRPAREAALTIAADTGAWLMAAAGFLQARTATVHWQLLNEFAEAFPWVRVSDDRFVRDEKFWTCGDASSALDMMLTLVEERYGRAMALDVSMMFVHDSAAVVELMRRRGGFTGKGSRRLRLVLSRMAETIEDPLSLEQLAALAMLSSRTLSRLFHDEVGMAPGQYYQLLRLSRARDLVEHSDLTLTDIAFRCGFSNASALGKAFSKRFGGPIGRARSRTRLIWRNTSFKPDFDSSK